MENFMFHLLMAAPQAGAEGAGGGSVLGTFLPLIAIILIFYLLIIRPQNKKRKETEKMLGALKEKDKVVTIGGLHGVITKVKESTVIIKVDDNVRLEFSRSAISSVTPAPVKEDKPEKVEDKSDEDKTDDKDEGKSSENGE
jgi:preprotein translocase subunit YajC